MSISFTMRSRFAQIKKLLSDYLQLEKKLAASKQENAKMEGKLQVCVLRAHVSLMLTVSAVCVCVCARAKVILMSIVYRCM